MRFLESIFGLFVFSSFMAAVLFISYNFLRFADIPLEIAVKSFGDLTDST